MSQPQFGRYTVLGDLGVGGMGRVFRAFDPALQREVAIKILRHDLPGKTGDLIAEARAASALNHANICTIFDVGLVDGSPFVAMELVDGHPLSDLLSRGALPRERVLRLGVQIAAALAHAHEQGVVHGDLKGQNVLVTPRDEVKLLDFGLAKRLDPVSVDSITRSADEVLGEMAGTLPFMSPETLRGTPASTASDVWSFGVLLHEMTSGARPFDGPTAAATASAIMNDAPHPLPSSTPPALAAVIGRCLEKQPPRRYRSARESLAALEPLVSDATTGARNVDDLPRPHSTGRRRATLALVGILIAAGVGLVWQQNGPRSPAGPALGKVTSLIVLPFDNLSGSADEDYFADGMTEALITDLSRIPSLTVISRTSSIRYKAMGKTSSEMASDLSVGAIVEGTVLRSEGRVRISVRLVDAASDRNVWGREYTRDLRDVLALQGEVARAIASEIRASFAPADEARLAGAARVNPIALEEFLKGRHHWNRRTTEGLTQAADHFRRAIGVDPDYGPAHAGLAQCYVLFPAFPLSAMSPSDALPLAVKEAELALSLDDRLVDAHGALAYAHLQMLDYPRAEEGFTRALALNPNDATLHFWFAVTLASMSRFDESIEHARRATALDPVSPIIASGLSFVHHLAGRFDLEVEAAQAALRLEPSFMMGRYRLGMGYLHQRRITEAIGELEAARAASDNLDLLATMAYAKGLAGQRREAIEALKTLTTLQAAGTQYVSPYAIALVHLGLDQREDALTWLSKAVDSKAWGAAFLAVEPVWDPLRSDPRFAALVARTQSISRGGQ
ncbi:MAG TPA: protein kinase [Vicinamibacterales bacterium]|nr:protein kinase [Vicinamibacterales bacterium]